MGNTYWKWQQAGFSWIMIMANGSQPSRVRYAEKRALDGGEPFPDARFAAHYRHRRHALHCKSEKDEQRHGASQREIAADGLLQPFVLWVRLHTVDRAHRSQDHFASRERSDQPDSDLPVES